MIIRRTNTEWAEIVEEYKKSGKTMTAFGREHGINLKTLGGHIRKGTVDTEQRSRQRSAEEWSVLIDRQKSSGLNRTAWCKGHGISPDTMTTAERRIKAQAEKPITETEWVELGPESKTTGLPEKKEEEGWGLRIHSGGLTIEVNIDYPMEKLSGVIERLVR